MSGSLGLGYGSSHASSDAQSNSYGYSSGISGDTQRSQSQGVSGGTSASNQTIAFQDIYNQLYGNATSAAGNAALMAPELQQAAKQLFSGGANFLNSLEQNPSTSYVDNRLTSSSPVDDIIASMKQDSLDLFNNQLNPAITANAVAGGNLGGGRQGVAQGTAMAQIVNDFSRNSAALRYQDVQAKDAIAQNSIAAATTGLGAMPNMLDVLDRGNNAELGTYSSLAQILGDPTTLTTSTANNFARNTAQSAADAFSRSFGEQTAESTATSRSRSKNWNFDSAFAIGGSV